ncbi:MAG: hypothetical protein OER86_09710 [Phycisphaerae bacterium]|nr:hypothetical protein [Phycisphaerae bacterium]
MLRVDSNILIQFPGDGDRRVLHKAKIIALREQTYTAELEEQALPIEAGRPALVFYSEAGRFMQQSAVVTATMQAGSRPVFGLEVTDEPTPGESRQCFRIATIIPERTAHFGAEDNCPILDVSVTGFAIVSTEVYIAGNTVPVTLNYEDEIFTGRARVQSVVQLDDGRFRYGLWCADERPDTGTLPEGLQKITMAMQREQLRRVSGNSGQG